MGIDTGLTEIVNQTILGVRVDRLTFVSPEDKFLQRQDSFDVVPNGFLQDDVHPPPGGLSGSPIGDVVFDHGSAKLFHAANKGIDLRPLKSCVAEGITDLEKSGAAIVIKKIPGILTIGPVDFKELLLLLVQFTIGQQDLTLVLQLDPNCLGIIIGPGEHEFIRKEILEVGDLETQLVFP